MIRARPLALGVISWLASAIASVAVGLLALSLVDTALITGPTLSSDGGLPGPIAASPSPPAGTTPSLPATGTGPAGASTTGPAAGTTKPAPAPPRRLDSAGGYVVAQCGTGGAYLLYWSPAPGFGAHDVRRGPAATARVAFEGDGREIKLAVTCVAGEPRASTSSEDGDEHPGDS